MTLVGPAGHDCSPSREHPGTQDPQWTDRHRTVRQAHSYDTHQTGETRAMRLKTVCLLLGFVITTHQTGERCMNAESRG